MQAVPLAHTPVKLNGIGSPRGLLTRTCQATEITSAVLPAVISDVYKTRHLRRRWSGLFYPRVAIRRGPLKMARSPGDDPGGTNFGDSSAPQRALRIQKDGQGLAWNAEL